MGYSNVLVPTDGSELAGRALEEALTVAGEDATIHVVYVVDDAAVAELAAGTGPEDVSIEANVGELFERFEAVGESAVEELRAAAAEQGVDVTTDMRQGVPEDEIIGYAEEAGVDAIVMGTHGRRGLRRYVLGSTTERVLRRAPVPVLAVRGED